MTKCLTRLPSTLMLCGCLSLLCAAPGRADTLTNGEADEPVPARLSLLDDMDAEGGLSDGADGRAWRLPARLVDLPAADEEDVRLRVKLRPNRAMGRVSLSF